MLDAPGLLFAALGAASLLAALLPRLLGRVPISMPMVFLGAGAAVFAIFSGLPDPDPIAHNSVALHLTEVCVIVSLMGAGLALDRPVRWREWSSTWRLLAITMPLSIVLMALLGWGVLGLGAAGALLLAAALAPTDPVLADEVQVGEPAEDPEEDPEDETRFALTSEAGLNDSLAFPFTYAAIAMAGAAAAGTGLSWVGGWLAVDVLWRVAVGLVVGFGLGWGLRTLFFRAPSKRFRLAEHAEGFVALAATFLAYGLAELAEGYGFLAVFVCACTIRSGERRHEYHRVLHQYVEQVERLITVVVLVLLGGALARGLLDGIGWVEIAVAAAFLLIVRPLTGWIALLGSGAGPRERAAIAFFGVRGVGSLFYIAYALHTVEFAEAERLWAVTGLVIAGSVLVHGIGATPAMMLLDRRRRQHTPEGRAAATTHV